MRWKVMTMSRCNAKQRVGSTTTQEMQRLGVRRSTMERATTRSTRGCTRRRTTSPFLVLHPLSRSSFTTKAMMVDPFGLTRTTTTTTMTCATTNTTTTSTPLHATSSSSTHSTNTFSGSRTSLPEGSFVGYGGTSIIHLILALVFVLTFCILLLFLICSTPPFIRRKGKGRRGKISNGASGRQIRRRRVFTRGEVILRRTRPFFENRIDITRGWNNNRSRTTSWFTTSTTNTSSSLSLSSSQKRGGHRRAGHRREASGRFRYFSLF